jgi:hypothetical protein
MLLGNFPYGNAPLDLPPSWDDEAELREHGGEAGGHRANEMTHADRDAWTREPVSSDRLFWFRWITGHQVSLLCWREAGRSLTAALEGRADSEAELGRAAAMLRTSTAMFVYTASCPRDVYHALIRPVMGLWHSAFTGKWAADYRPLPRLVSRLRAAAPPRAGAIAVRQAFRESQQVHVAAALKLVPGGQSMLQQFVRDREAATPVDLGVATFIYDSFFLIRRRPVSRHALAAALRDRADAIRLDLEVNGLYPESASSRTDVPTSVHGEVFRGYEGAVARALAEAVGDAAATAGTSDVTAEVPVGV